jgi:hypothetical protein
MRRRTDIQDELESWQFDQIQRIRDMLTSSERRLNARLEQIDMDPASRQQLGLDAQDADKNIQSLLHATGHRKPTLSELDGERDG